MSPRKSSLTTTIRDVAARVNVSPMTVSRVLNGNSSVHPETRQRVENAIRELGYSPLSQQRDTVQKRSSHTIALILPSIANPFFNKVAHGVETAADSHDYRVIICSSNNDTQRERRSLRDFVNRRVDGVIIAPCSDLSREALEQFDQYQIPTVLVDREIAALNIDVVQGDNVKGASQLTQHLIKQGHRRIGFISTDNRISTSRDRMYGYRSALDMAGIAFDSSLIYEESIAHEDNGYAMAYKLLTRPDRPSAVVTGNCLVLMGFVHACADLCIRIPNDIAVVSFDDIEFASVLCPFFTVMDLPAVQIGIHSMERLIQIIRQPESKPINRKLATNLIVRRSCGNTVHDAFLYERYPFRQLV
ncbi:MAG: LacI family DNA-binding transcriptional regulator [Roseiflexaceae bacterium]|jgi:LacI family transcriptional regulator